MGLFVTWHEMWWFTQIPFIEAISCHFINRDIRVANFCMKGKRRSPQNFHSNIGNVNCFVVVDSRRQTRPVFGSSGLIRVTPYSSTSQASSNWDLIAGTIPQQPSMTSLTEVSSEKGLPLTRHCFS